MSIRLSQTAHAQRFLEEASGNLNDAGNPRAKALIYRILRDTVNIIEDLEVTPRSSGRRSTTSMIWVKPGSRPARRWPGPGALPGPVDGRRR